MKNVIVTGANGFVGSAVVKELLANGYRVYALIHHGHRDRLPEHPALNCVSGDMQDFAAVAAKLPDQKYTCLYHFAWMGSAGTLRGEVEVQLRNILWTSQLLHVTKTLGCPRVVCAGSIMEWETLAAVYGPERIPGVGYIYGGAKVAAHIMNMMEAAQLGISLIWGSITNAYGPGEISPRLVNTSIQKCLQGISPQFTSGTQNYDFVYIDDAARAFRLIGEKGKAQQNYLIGSSHAKPLKEFLVEMQEAVAPQIPFLFGDVPFKGIDLPLSAFDCSMTENDTGFKAEVLFGEGCRRTAEWWKGRWHSP